MKTYIITSFINGYRETNSSLLLISSYLKSNSIDFKIIDNSGIFDYYNPPCNFFCSSHSKLWGNIDSIRSAQWLDKYLPKIYNADNIVFLAPFSIDLVADIRLATLVRKNNPNAKMIIGGSAINTLPDSLLKQLNSVFDIVGVGLSLNSLQQLFTNIHDYSNNDNNFVKKITMLPNLFKNNVNIFTGHGCYWSRCKFCDFNSRTNHFFYRPISVIIDEIEDILSSSLSINKYLLTSNSCSYSFLRNLSNQLKTRGIKIPYSIMIRADKWINEELIEQLLETGCVEVFIGVEALNDEMLRNMNKGLSVENIRRVIKLFSKYIKPSIGLITYLPNTKEINLIEQEKNLIELIPFIYEIELERLSITYNSEYIKDPNKYEINLYPEGVSINNEWCFGFSNDVPWNFSNSKNKKIWDKYNIRLINMAKHLIPDYYIEAIEKILY